MCPGYDTKQSDGEVPVMLELWGMWSTLLVPLLTGSLWYGVVAPDRILSMGQIELNSLLMLNWIVWNRTFFYIWLCVNKELYLCETELFEKELFICIIMDSELNNL